MPLANFSKLSKKLNLNPASLYENMLWYSPEALHQSTSNEYPRPHIFQAFAGFQAIELTFFFISGFQIFIFLCTVCLKRLFKAAEAGLSGMEKLNQYEAWYPQHVFMEKLYMWTPSVKVSSHL